MDTLSYAGEQWVYPLTMFLQVMSALMLQGTDKLISGQLIELEPIY